MFYVASIREPGCLCAEARIFDSYEEALSFIQQSEGCYTHIEICETQKQAQSEFEYQTQASVGKK